MKINGIKEQIKGASKDIVKYKANIGALANAYDSVREKSRQFNKVIDKSPNKKSAKYDTKAIRGYIDNYKKDFDPNDISGMTINGEAFKIKNISSYSKEVLKLRGNIKQLKQEESEIGNIKIPNFSKNESEKRTITGAKTINLESSSINMWSILKEKISSIKPTIQAIQSIFKNTFNSKKPNAELELLNIKISEVKAKLNNAKLNMDYRGVLEAEVELEKLNTKKQKLENRNKGNFFSSFFSSLKKVIPSMNNVSEITIKIKNTIKQWGGGLKSGLGHVLKYAGALFSLQSIYSALSNSARSWLSSQNAGAKQLSANIDYMKYAMGSTFAPVIQYVTNLVYQLMKAIQSVAYALTGVNIFAKASASSYASMAGSAKKAKNETKSLAGVHNEINNISNNNNSDSGSEGTVTPSFDLSGLDNTHNSIIEAIKNGNWHEIGATIGQKLNEAMNNIPWNKIQDTTRKIGTNIAQFLNGFIETTNWNDLGNTFAQGLNTALNFLNSFAKNFNWKETGRAIIDGINGFLDGFDWKMCGETIGEFTKGLLDIMIIFIEEYDFQKFPNKIAECLANIDWSQIINKIFELLGAALVKFSVIGAVMNVAELILKICNLAVEYFKPKIEECGGNVMLGLLEGIAEIGDNIGQWIVDHIFQPFIDGFKNAFGIHSPSTVMAEMGVYLVEGLLQGLLDLWNRIKAPFEEFGTNVSNKFSEIKSKIIDWTNNTKITVSNWGNNVKSKISECWSNASSTIGEKVNNMKNSISKGLNNAKSTISIWGDNIKNTFTNLGRNATTWGKDLATNMASGIRNNIGKVTNAVNSVANKIKSFLHFTEPDEGPLSNFHTYMPDMIDLMVSGIKSNTNKIKNEMENLAGTMSYTINTEAVTNIPSTNANINPINTRSSNSLFSMLNDIMAYKEGNNNDRPIYLTVNVGNSKIGQILLDNLRDMKRQTGKDIEALVGD